MVCNWPGVLGQAPATQYLLDKSPMLSLPFIYDALMDAVWNLILGVSSFLPSTETYGIHFIYVLHCWVVQKRYPLF